MNVSGTVKPSINFQAAAAGWLSGQSVGLSPPTTPSITFANGTGAGQCDRVLATTLTLAAAAQAIDLTNYTDPLGNAAQAMARVRYLYLRNNATTDGWVLTVGNAGSNEWSGASAPLSASGTIKVGPSTTGAGTAAVNSGILSLSAPGATGYVVDSTHKLLNLDPGAHTFDVEILVIGASV